MVGKGKSSIPDEDLTPYQRFSRYARLAGLSLEQSSILWNSLDKPLKTSLFWPSYFSEGDENIALFPDQVSIENAQHEGAVSKVLVNAYERNPKARRICIEHYGANCSICGFNFEKVYGRLGKNFIHVHHLRPLSEIRQEYEVDPIADLRPVCPNCHAMIHLRTPPFSIEELKELLM